MVRFFRAMQMAPRPRHPIVFYTQQGRCPGQLLVPGAQRAPVAGLLNAAGERIFCRDRVVARLVVRGGSICRRADEHPSGSGEERPYWLGLDRR